MLKELALQSVLNGLALVVVVIATITTAHSLGPSGFGQYAATQAASLILLPIATLRIETRIATCKSREELSKLVSAAATCSLLFVIIGVTITPIVGIYFSWEIVFSVIIAGASASLVETLMSCYSYKGDIRSVIKYRALKQVLPSVLVMATSFVYEDFQLAIVALVIGLITTLIIMWLPVRHICVWSMVILRKILLEHFSQLRASFLLGILNAIWSNGLLPLMSAIGLSVLAGQFAIIQRLMNTPLGVIGVSVQSILLKRGNQLHQKAQSIIGQFALLLLTAVVLVSGLYFSIYIQKFYVFPDEWKLDKPFFFAVCFFFANSFAVGTMSIIAIRQKDEWFLFGWQLALISFWLMIFIYYPSGSAFIFMLILGGAGYWVLLTRWIILSKIKNV